jgi:hypothetical protein
MVAATARSLTGPVSPPSCTWPAPHPLRLLPARELGCGSPAICWRRLTEWANAGVFDDTTVFQAVMDDVPPIRLPQASGVQARQAGRRQGL